MPPSRIPPLEAGRGLRSHRLERSQKSAYLSSVCSWVPVGGSAGALLRAAVGQALPPSPGAWPWATLALLVNLAGTALLSVRLTTILTQLVAPGCCCAHADRHRLLRGAHDILHLSG